MSMVALPCSCVGTCSVAVVMEYDGEPPEIFVEFYEQVEGRTFRTRLSRAWKVLRGQRVCTRGICIQDADKLTELRDLIDRVLEGTA